MHSAPCLVGAASCSFVCREREIVSGTMHSETQGVSLVVQ